VSAPSREAPATEPMIHSIAARKVSTSAKMMTRRMTALKNAPMTTPESRSTRVSNPPLPAPAIARTRTIASIAPPKADSGSATSEVAVMPKTRAMTAPTAAPLEIPST